MGATVDIHWQGVRKKWRDSVFIRGKVENFQKDLKEEIKPELNFRE